MLIQSKFNLMCFATGYIYFPINHIFFVPFSILSFNPIAIP